MFSDEGLIQHKILISETNQLPYADLFWELEGMESILTLQRSRDGTPGIIYACREIGKHASVVFSLPTLLAAWIAGA